MSPVTTSWQLAIEGGMPACPASPPSWPPEDPDVLAALQEAYESGSWGKYEGPALARLSQLLAEMHQAEFVLPCCSGTIAVELALRGLRIEPEDEVILAGYDFPGNFRAIEALGAIPVLIDVAPGTWSLDASQVNQAIGPRTRAVIASHLHGGMVDMRRLREIAAARGLAIVEDACQTPGAMVHGRLAGTWGDVGVLSFGGSKLLSAGRGGALITRREEVWQRAKIYSERGNQAFPLSELQAAVLIPQLKKLGQRNELRRKNVEFLIKKLAAQSAMLVQHSAVPPDCVPAYYKLAWRYQASPEWTRERFLAAVQAEGIPLDAGFRGFVRRSQRCRRAGDLVHSQSAAESTVLLHHPVLLTGTDRLDDVARGIAKVCAAAIASPETSTAQD